MSVERAEADLGIFNVNTGELKRYPSTYASLRINRPCPKCGFMNHLDLHDAGDALGLVWTCRGGGADKPLDKRCCAPMLENAEEFRAPIRTAMALHTPRPALMQMARELSRKLRADQRRRARGEE